jgi:voltage-gated potassium channel Kch
MLISLMSILKRFLTVMKAGWRDGEFRGLSIVLGSWVALGTIIYSVREGWSIIDSLYFSVMTLTTIGYGDFSPTTSWMRLYTVIYAVMGIGLFVAFNAQLARFAFESRRHEEKAGPNDQAEPD